MGARQRGLMLAVAYFMAFSFLFARQSYPPVIPNVMRTLGISYGEAGLLMSIIAVSGIFLALPCWILMARWGLKVVGGLGLVVCTLGALVTSVSTSFVLLGVGRFILGVGGTLTMVSSFSVVPLWFARRDRGKAMGIKAWDMPVASFIALNLQPMIASNYGWRSSFIISTAVLLASTVFFFLLFKDKPQKQSVSTFQGLTNPQVWILGVTWAFFTMSTVSYTTWAGTFFIETKDMSTGLAFFMASVFSLSSIVLNPLIGAVSDRVGKRKVFILTSSVGMTVSLLFIGHMSLPLLLLPTLLLAVVEPFLPVNTFTLLSEIFSPERAGLGFGILLTFSYIGALVGPLLTGYARDVFPSFPSFFMMAIFSFLALISASLLRTSSNQKD